MKSIKNPIVTMTIFLTIILPEGRGELKNEVTFKRVGELAVGATYGHLTFDIDLDRVRIAYDALQDTLKHVINAQQNVPALQGQKEEVKMVWEKLEILYALVQHDQIKAEVDEDEQDRVGSALNQLRNKRQLLAAVAGIMGLTSFGTSMYSIGQLKTLKDNIGEQGERIEFLSHQIQEQDLRIYNITQATRRYVEESVDAIGKVAEETRRLTIVKALETSARTYLLNFRMALTDLTIGITELMEGRLSPLLIDPHKLDEAYRNLLAAAKKVGLEPVSLHPGIVFQTPVSVLGKDDRQLVVMVHVPLNAGTLILYKYLPSPIIFEDKDVALYVEDEEKYLAMDAHQTIGLQLTPREFDRCLKMKGVYSCKKSHVFTKSLERLCLYNLFVQRTEEVSKTCQVKVGPLKSSVSQIKTNAYRLYSPGRVTVTSECLNGSVMVQTAHKTAVVELTRECPKISTEDYLLTYRVNINGKADLVSLPSVVDMSTWMGETNNIDDNSLKEALVAYTSTYEKETTVPLPEFKARLAAGPWRKVVHKLRYVQDGITIIVGGVIVFWCLRLMYKYCLPQFERISALRGRRANCHGSSRPSAGKRRDMVMTTVNDESSGPIVEARPVRGLQWIE